MSSKENTSPHIRIANDKDAILEHMAAGLSFRGACRELGYPYSTVYTWRVKDAVFDEHCRRLVEAQGDKGYTPSVDPELMDWKARFVVILQTTQNRGEALRSVGKRVKELEAALAEDEDFAERVREVLALRQWNVEDQRYKLASEGKSTMVRDFLAPPEKGGQGQLGGGPTQINVFGGEEGLDFARGFLSNRFGSDTTFDAERLRGSPKRLGEDVPAGEDDA